MNKQSLKTYIELLEKGRDEMIETIEGLKYAQRKSKEFANWAKSTIDGLNKDLHDAKDTIERMMPLRDSHDRQAQELDEKDRMIRDLKEHIGNLEEALRKGGN